MFLLQILMGFQRAAFVLHYTVPTVESPHETLAYAGVTYCNRSPEAQLN
jgi:hypothetical protein